MSKIKNREMPLFIYDVMISEIAKEWTSSEIWEALNKKGIVLEGEQRACMAYHLHQWPEYFVMEGSSGNARWRLKGAPKLTAYQKRLAAQRF